jgi:DNA-binding response OmpR family regulator
MSSRIIKVLHVEDELSQRLVLAHHLTAIKDLQFKILYANAEQAALETFDSGDIDFVIVDYHLSQGNGLHCLEELRRRDQVVPIIAVSGVATEEIAAELLQAGADDYIGKRDLTSGQLATSLRHALARADACRRRDAGHRG